MFLTWNRVSQKRHRWRSSNCDPRITWFVPTFSSITYDTPRPGRIEISNKCTRRVFATRARFLRNPVATKHARFQSEHDFSAHLPPGSKARPTRRGSAELTSLVAGARVSGMNSSDNGALVCVHCVFYAKGGPQSRRVIRQLSYMTIARRRTTLWSASLWELGRVGT